jgi:site-specific DNA-methyltransferase (adenine-specific)
VKVLPRNTVLPGDAAHVLAKLLPESVDCVVTSPPYFGLRDYGMAGQLGREAHVREWVARLRQVFRGLARVLKPTGSVWLNVGDAYSRHRKTGAAPKGLFAAPERLLLVLLADGWRCRNKVVWAKPNPLPQSATDRLSPTYELVYFLTRSRRYFFDLDAIRIPHRSRRDKPERSAAGRLYQGGNDGLSALKVAGRVGHRNGKNPGDVWTIATASYRGEHFATFPEALIERPILATCPERICVQCDRAWRRRVRVLTVHTNEGTRPVRKVGELRRCDCFAPSRPGVVLDPFFGTGTVGVVAERLGRDWLGIELNPAYAALAERRISQRRAA